MCGQVHCLHSLLSPVTNYRLKRRPKGHPFKLSRYTRCSYAFVEKVLRCLYEFKYFFLFAVCFPLCFSFLFVAIAFIFFFWRVRLLCVFDKSESILLVFVAYIVRPLVAQVLITCCRNALNCVTEEVKNIYVYVLSIYHCWLFDVCITNTSLLFQRWFMLFISIKFVIYWISNYANWTGRRITGILSVFCSVLFLRTYNICQRDTCQNITRWNR